MHRNYCNNITNPSACQLYFPVIYQSFLPVADAVRAASYNPARSIGMDDRIGSLTEGKEATFVLLDKETLEIKKIVFKGKTVK